MIDKLKHSWIALNLKLPYKDKLAVFPTGWKDKKKTDFKK